LIPGQQPTGIDGHCGEPGRKVAFRFFGRDFLVDVVDLAVGKIVKRFRRTYPRVPHVERVGKSILAKVRSPEARIRDGYQGLYPIEGRVWVETSTEDKTKGWLIDVFDKDGRFIDSFYLGPGRKLMAVREGHIFCQEKNEDETITIVKYRIGN
jgi:hypothetical protein